MTASTDRLGLVVRDLPGTDVALLARRAEDAGFTDLFLPEMGYVATGNITGRDPFIAAASALAATTRLRVGPGVAITPVRAARAMALLAAGLQENSGGRFVLGCGVSHAGALAAIGIPFPASPIAHTTGYLAELRELSRHTLAFGRGFPVLLGALGPRMLRLSATGADGAILNWLTPRHATATVETMRAAAAETGSPAPETALYIRIGPDERLEAEAGTYFSTFPSYRRHFHRQGIDTIAEAAKRTTIRGTDPAAVHDALAAYRSAGITLPTLSPAGLSPGELGALLTAVGTAGNRR